MSTDPNQFLMGGGGKSAKFETPGVTITGTIAAEPEVRQQTEFQTGKLQFWDNGDPMMQLVVKLQTTERDPDDKDDDGIRALYVKGGFKKPTMQKAIADAVRAAGVKGLEIGGTLTVTYTGDGPKEGSGFPPKYYSATYAPPSANFLATGEVTTTATAVSPTSTALPAAANGDGLITMPDGQRVTPEVAALLASMQAKQSA